MTRGMCGWFVKCARPAVGEIKCPWGWVPVCQSCVQSQGLSAELVRFKGEEK